MGKIISILGHAMVDALVIVVDNMMDDEDGE